MASISAASHFSTSLPISLSSSSSSSTFHPTKHKRHHLCKVSCHTNEERKPSHNIAGKNRRNVLIGFGGLYGASTLANNPLAIAAPTSPDFNTCGPPEIPKDVPSTNCCPPQSSTIIDFKFPPPTTPLRVRPAAQFIDETYLAKYKKALSIMRSLPPQDPRIAVSPNKLISTVLTAMVPITKLATLTLTYKFTTPGYSSLSIVGTFISTREYWET